MSVKASPAVSLALLAFAYFILGTGSLAVIGLIEPMATHFVVAPAEVAHLVTVFALTFSVAAPLQQMFFGHWPRRNLLMMGLVVLALGSLATALAPSFAWAFAARIVMALGASAVGPVASALGAGLVAREEQSRALATVFAGLTIATVLGVPLSAWVGHVLSWQAVFVTLSIAAILCCIALGVLIGDRSTGQRIGGSDLWAVFARSDSAFAILTTLIQMSAQFVTYALVAVVLKEQFHVPVAGLSLALFLYGVGGIAGNIFAGRIGDRVGADPLVWASLAVLMTLFLLMANGPAMPQFALGLMVFWAVGSMLFQTPQQKRLISIVPSLRSLLLAMNASALYLGMSLGSFMAARVYLSWGGAMLPWVSAALIGLASLSHLKSQMAVRRRHASCTPSLEVH